MSDRVAVFNHGRIQQIDTPRTLYMQPATAFVAEFVGTSNVLRDTLAQQLTGSNSAFAIRPEHVRLGDGTARSSDDVEVSGLLQDIQYQGAATRYELKLDNGQTFTVSEANNQHRPGGVPCQPGQRITARWPRAAMVALREEA